MVRRARRSRRNLKFRRGEDGTGRAPRRSTREREHGCERVDNPAGWGRNGGIGAVSRQSGGLRARRESLREDRRLIDGESEHWRLARGSTCWRARMTRARDRMVRPAPDTLLLRKRLTRSRSRCHCRGCGCLGQRTAKRRREAIARVIHHHQARERTDNAPRSTGENDRVYAGFITIKHGKDRGDRGRRTSGFHRPRRQAQPETGRGHAHGRQRRIRARGDI